MFLIDSSAFIDGYKQEVNKTGTKIQTVFFLLNKAVACNVSK